MTMAEAIELLGLTPLVLLLSGLALAVVGIAIVVFLGLWTYNDAKERTDNPSLWTVIVLFATMPIGLIIYLLLGRNKTGQSTGRYLKPLIATAAVFVLNLFTVIGSSIYLLVLMSQNGLM